jgi:DNA-binding beta-propeller fold protein YncE
MENLHTDLQDARSRVGELEKEKWLSNITLLAEPYQEGSSGYTYQESGSAYVYQIPLVTDADQIALSDDDTAIVIHFTQPGRLPSNAALSTSGNNLLVSFANKPTRRIDITSIHVYKEK